MKTLPVKLPTELIHKVTEHSPICDISRNLHTKKTEDLQALEDRLVAQCQKLGQVVYVANSYYWDKIWQAKKFYDASPEAYSKGSWEEAIPAFKHSLAPLWQTDVLFELLNYAYEYGPRRDPMACDWDQADNTWYYFLDAPTAQEGIKTQKVKTRTQVTMEPPR